MDKFRYIILFLLWVLGFFKSFAFPANCRRTNVLLGRLLNLQTVNTRRNLDLEDFV